MTVRIGAPRPWNPTADLDPAMRACERYIRDHDPLHPRGKGNYLPPEEAKAPAWKALLARLDAACGRSEPVGQLGLFDEPGRDSPAAGRGSGISSPPMDP